MKATVQRVWLVTTSRSYQRREYVCIKANNPSDAAAEFLKERSWMVEEGAVLEVFEFSPPSEVISIELEASDVPVRS